MNTSSSAAPEFEAQKQVKCKRKKMKRKVKCPQQVESVSDEIRRNKIERLNKLERKKLRVQNSNLKSGRQHKIVFAGDNESKIISEKVVKKKRNELSLPLTEKTQYKRQKKVKPFRTDHESRDVRKAVKKMHKTNKRERDISDEAGQMKQKITLDHYKEIGNADVKEEKACDMHMTRRQKRNRRKKNSCKNKYKHLALNKKQEGSNSSVFVNTSESQQSSLTTHAQVQHSPVLFCPSRKTDVCSNEKTAQTSPKLAPEKQSSSASKKYAQNALKIKQINKTRETQLQTAVVGKEQETPCAGSVDRAPNTEDISDVSESGDEHNMDGLSTNDDSSLQSHSCDATYSGQVTETTEAPPQKEKTFKKSKSFSVFDKAREKLNAARFRYLNETLYSSTGKEAQEVFQDDPEAFQVYHQGFQAQVSRWPLNPLDAIIKQLKNMPKNAVIADFGCGNACLAESLPQNKVFSFDLVATKPCVTACNFAKVPVDKNSIDVAVFCLSLMGTNLSDYLCEANRVLKNGGLLEIAEVVSRFYSINTFIRKVEALGFQLLQKVCLGKIFQLFTFQKIKNPPKSAPVIQLKICQYKRR